MIQSTPSNREMQAQRLKIKQFGQQMQNLATEGAGLSAWEARELVRIIDEVYFSDPDLKQILPGQMKYSCVSAAEPAGKPIKDCQMVTVTLTMPHDEDTTTPLGKYCTLYLLFILLLELVFKVILMNLGIGDGVLRADPDLRFLLFHFVLLLNSVRVIVSCTSLNLS